MRTIIRDEVSEETITKDIQDIMFNMINAVTDLDKSIMSICGKIGFYPDGLGLIPNIRTAVRGMDIQKIIETQKLIILDLQVLSGFLIKLDEKI